MRTSKKRNLMFFFAIAIYFAFVIYMKLGDPNGLYATYRSFEGSSGDYNYFLNSLYFIPPRWQSIFDIYFVEQFLLNMLLMVPFGYFIAKLISNKALMITLIICGCFLLEILQPLLMVGVLSSITIMFEIIGAFLGVAAAKYIPCVLTKTVTWLVKRINTGV